MVEQAKPKRRSRAHNTKPAQLAADLRHMAALRLRLAKFTLQEIADTVGYDTPSGAKAAVAAGMMKVGILPTQEAVAAELADLHLLEESIMKRAVGQGDDAPPDLDAIKAVLEIKKARRALQGLDAPTKVAHTDPTGQHLAPVIVLPAVDGSLLPAAVEQATAPAGGAAHDTDS